MIWKIFSKIPYPIDLSEPSKRAMKYLKKLKETEVKEVAVLHVIDEHELGAMIEGCSVSENVVRRAKNQC